MTTIKTKKGNLYFSDEEFTLEEIIKELEKRGLVSDD